MMSDPTACQSCGAPLSWALTASGRPIPLDPEPVRGGNIRVTDAGGAEVVSALEVLAARIVGPRLHVSHFSTCPNAGNHR